MLTAENIEAARAFLASSDYAMKAATYGAEAFKQIQLNFLIIRPTLMLPTSIANLFQYANGLFILPILAGVSQFVMNSVMSGKQTKKPEAGDNPMNLKQRIHEMVLPAVFRMDLRQQQRCVLDLLDGGQCYFDHPDCDPEQIFRAQGRASRTGGEGAGLMMN